MDYFDDALIESFVLAPPENSDDKDDGATKMDADRMDALFDIFADPQALEKIAGVIGVETEDLSALPALVFGAEGFEDMSGALAGATAAGAGALVSDASMDGMTVEVRPGMFHGDQMLVIQGRDGGRGVVSMASDGEGGFDGLSAASDAAGAFGEMIQALDRNGFDVEVDGDLTILHGKGATGAPIIIVVSQGPDGPAIDVVADGSPLGVKHDPANNPYHNPYDDHGDSRNTVEPGGSSKTDGGAGADDGADKTGTDDNGSKSDSDSLDEEEALQEKPPAPETAEKEPAGDGKAGQGVPDEHCGEEHPVFQHIEDQEPQESGPSRQFYMVAQPIGEDGWAIGIGDPIDDSFEFIFFNPENDEQGGGGEPLVKPVDQDSGIRLGDLKPNLSTQSDLGQDPVTNPGDA
jgi:hypothetical protein